MPSWCQDFAEGLCFSTLRSLINKFPLGVPSSVPVALPVLEDSLGLVAGDPEAPTMAHVWACVSGVLGS